MLKKTNYYLDLNNDADEQKRADINNFADENQNSLRSKLRPTGRLIDKHLGKESSKNKSNNKKTFGNETNQKYNSNGSVDSSRFVEEEIAPGVTVSGYEIDI